MKKIDPVCGMEVEVEKAQYRSEYEGESYYFCGPGCKHEFDEDPESFVGKAKEQDGEVG